MVTILSFLLGAVLGTRYKVFSLIPTGMSGIAAIAIHGVIAGVQVGAMLQTMLGLIVALQVGYLFGLAVRWTTVAARVRAEPAEPIREQSSPIV